MTIKLCSDIIDKQDVDNLISWLQTLPKLTKGNKTLEFEEMFSSYLGCDHSVFCNSGSSANLLITSALIQSGMLKNSKIVVPQVSWSTTVFPAMQLGMQPIMCDCNLLNLGIDIDHFSRIIKEHKPSALILVHVLGLDSNVEKILEICQENGIFLIEDTCESLGSATSGSKLGSFGLASSFSFYFGHHISTIEGGMVCTNDKDFADIIKMIRSHGWDRDLDEETKLKYKKRHNVKEFDALYKFYYEGFNLRSTDLQAVIGINQIPKIQNISEIRQRNYKHYLDNIKDDLWKPKSDQETVSNMGYPLIVGNREELSKALVDNDIECRPLVSGSMGAQPAWKNKYGQCTMKNASVVNDSGMYVPNHQDLTTEDINKVCKIINDTGNPHV